MIQTLQNYNHANRSFKRRAIYHIGLSAGFFSEYNNMILAMAWCLRHKYQFQLYSRYANFGFNRGWTDYFIPFCIEVFGKFHHKFNYRPYPYWQNSYYPFFLRVLFKLGLLKTEFDYIPPFHRLQKKLGLGILLTQDIFVEVRNQSTIEDIEIPEIRFTGNLRSLCKLLTDINWRFNQETQELVDALIKELNLPEKYIGFHIRGGDKYVEYQRIPASSYIKKAETLSEIRTAFVLTDDYSIVTELRTSFPSWHFYTLCLPQEKGYYHMEFKQLSNMEKKNSHIRLFSSMVVLEKASQFIGTFSSNPGMFLGMRMSPKNCHGVDFDEWLIW